MKSAKRKGVEMKIMTNLKEMFTGPNREIKDLKLHEACYTSLYNKLDRNKKSRKEKGTFDVSMMV